MLVNASLLYFYSFRNLRNEILKHAKMYNIVTELNTTEHYYSFYQWNIYTILLQDLN